MAFQPGQGKTAVGLFVDGVELKFVHLSIKGNVVTLRDFKTAALISKFSEKQEGELPQEEATAFGDMTQEDFNAPAGATEPGAEEGANTNATVLLGMLGDLPSDKYTLSYALSEPAITYQEFDDDFGLQGSKLRKRLIEELTTSRTSPPALDGIDVIPSANGGILAVIREDGLNIYDLLTEVRSFLGGRIPNIKLIESSDLALMEMVRVNYEVQEEEISVIVYVGHDFSRLVFMKGREYLHFAPIISEGYGSANIENTIYSRILLEQDNIALTRIDRILLCGECHKVNLMESLGPQFSSANVEYMKAPELDLSLFEGSVGEAVSEYAIPLMTAWRALQPKHEGMFDTNLVPLSIIEAQKAFKLAWHGWLAAVAIIFSIVYFYTAILARNQEIRRTGEELVQKRTRLSELDVFRTRKDMLTQDINRYSTATTVYDSIAPGGDRWSRILHYLANSVEDLNSMWIHRIGPDPQNTNIIIITGRSIYRTRITRIASIFERATLREVRTTTIRKKIVYEFDIAVEKVDKNDIPELPFIPGR